MPPTPRDHLAAYEAALDNLLRAAMAVGKATSHADYTRAIARATVAKSAARKALEDLRKSERAEGRTGSANWISAQLAVYDSSAAVTGADDILTVVQRALRQLRSATW